MKKTMEDIEMWVEILLAALKYTAASGSEPRCITGLSGVLKKFRIRETPNLSTDVVNSTA